MTSSVWDWLVWALSGLAALVAAAVGFLLLRKKPVATPLPAQVKAETEFAATVESAQREYEAAAVAAAKKREEAKVEVVRGLEEKSGPLLEDDDALTAHLRDVGEEARKGP